MEHPKTDINEYNHFTPEEKVGFINFVTLVGELLFYMYEDEVPLYIMASPEASNSAHVHIPQILYRLVSKEPGLVGEGTRDYRPRIRHVQREMSDTRGEEVPVEYKTQAVDATVRFSIYGDNREIIRWSYRIKDAVNKVISFFSNHPGEEQFEALRGIKRVIWLSENDTSYKDEGKHYNIQDIDFLLQHDEIIRTEQWDLKSITTKINTVTNINEFKELFVRKREYRHTPKEAITTILKYIDKDSVKTYNGKELKERDGYLHIGYLDGWDYYLDKEGNPVKHEIGEYTEDIVVEEIIEIKHIDKDELDKK